MAVSTVTVNNVFVKGRVAFNGFSIGKVTLNNGTAIIPNEKITNKSLIITVIQQPGILANIGNLRIDSRIPGESFTIKSSNILDNSVVGWIIFESVQ